MPPSAIVGSSHQRGAPGRRVKRRAEQRTRSLMSKPADRRILGLSPRARRVVVPVLVIAAVLVVIAYFSSARSGESSRADAVVVAGPHVAGDPEQRIFESGQGGAGHRADTAGWAQHSSLDGNDVIGWSSTGAEAQAAGRARGLR